MRRTSEMAMLAIAVITGCAPPTDRGQVSAALHDTLLTLFDSMVAIHQAIPDTALLRRMHPAADTILFVEGLLIHRFTGDSLVRRVAAAHHDVQSMGPQIDQRAVLLLDDDHAMLTGRERVNWQTSAGAHQWEGVLTLVASRGGDRWAIRGYRH